MEKYNLPEKLIQEMTEIRQYLHKNPELSGKEYKTTEFIKEFLSKNEITFENTSADFSRANSRYEVKWIE